MSQPTDDSGHGIVVQTRAAAAMDTASSASSAWKSPCWCAIRRHSKAAVLAALALAAACSSDKGASALYKRELTNGVSTITVDGKALAAVPSWRFDSLPRFDIASAASEEEGLSKVTGVQSLDGSSVVVGDQGSERLLFYGGDGGYRFAKGGRGRGPGEFTELTLLTVDDPRTIAVFDPAKLQATVFDHEGNVSKEDRIGRVAQLIHRFADGSYLARSWPRRPSPSRTGTVSELAHIARLSGDGHVLTEYGTFLAEKFVLRIGPRGLTGGPPPFRQPFLVAARDSVVAVSSGQNYEIQLFAQDGRKTREIRVERPPSKVTRAHVAHFRDSVLSRYAKDEYTTREWTMLSSDDAFPESFPEISALRFDRAGRLWVRDYMMPGATTATWTVFASDGTPIGRIRVPYSFVPFDILTDRILGVRRDADDVEHVVSVGFYRD